MGYLQPTEYESYGLSADTTDDWITVASALMEAYCRRASLAVAQYTERLRITSGAQAVRLTYLPLAAAPPGSLPFVSVQARYSHPRRGELADNCGELWQAFSLPRSWVALDPASLDWTPDGEITLPCSVLGLAFNELAVTYTAGLSVIPDAVKSACALIVKSAQSTPSMNVKTNRVDMLQVQYFSDQLVDSTVKTLLRPWVANRLG
ncbi:hypothetical protein [Acidipila sp. EB88]|uniref:hypothetical protein n=1 Tax=Acidipila sp. EB88 TaxID=2305226 RepID=UPI000F5E23A4|nr:hypothetical protein [Acidipila sp. EB88]RRA48222.1 hypothetical protein D1Y84_07905 [Acidipila sp. EB88]